jgi:hypothetical protein
MKTPRRRGVFPKIGTQDPHPDPFSEDDGEALKIRKAAGSTPENQRWNSEHRIPDQRLSGPRSGSAEDFSIPILLLFASLLASLSSESQ